MAQNAWAVFLLLTMFLAGCQPPVSSPEPERKSAPARAGKQKRRPRPSEQGRFDYYVVSLSWSPQYCASPTGQKDTVQCAPSREYGFVLHGLWPQNERGWPEFCGQEPVPADIVDQMMPLMPSRRLIEHEWKKHGTCSGLSVKDYFDQAAESFRDVKIPGAYQGPKKQITVTPDGVRESFLKANPGHTAASVAVLCRGRFLSEVRICLNKDFGPRDCSPEVQKDHCRLDEIIMRPVR
jgi:ribonuclease T2